MGLEYSIETLNLNVVRKRSGSNSSRKNIRESNTSIQNSNYELGSSVPGLEVRSQSVAATVLDSVLFGNTVQGELTRDIWNACGVDPENEKSEEKLAFEKLNAFVPKTL